jgi:hypothetical protein
MAPGVLCHWRFDPRATVAPSAGEISVGAPVVGVADGVGVFVAVGATVAVGAIVGLGVGVAVPVAFGVMIAVSLATRRSVPANVGRVMVQLHAPEAVADELRGFSKAR